MKHSVISRIVLLFFLVSGWVLISSGCKERGAGSAAASNSLDLRGGGPGAGLRQRSDGDTERC